MDLGCSGLVRGGVAWGASGWKVGARRRAGFSPPIPSPRRVPQNNRGQSRRCAQPAATVSRGLSPTWPPTLGPGATLSKMS